MNYILINIYMIENIAVIAGYLLIPFCIYIIWRYIRRAFRNQ